eukprot:2022506-Prymnesium_polylepis.1
MSRPSGGAAAHPYPLDRVDAGTRPFRAPRHAAPASLARARAGGVSVVLCPRVAAAPAARVRSRDHMRRSRRSVWRRSLLSCV